MGSCAAPSAKGDDKFITTDYLQQCRPNVCSSVNRTLRMEISSEDIISMSEDL
uniref:TniA putative transposase n=1 Tax=Enterobacter cloacae TaxID=550 RepID=A0A0G3B346_ENTCL|nr:hypothetical protein [Enterobacter cloacae]AKJ19237.1 TniA putative transposase [Enterobacter cloacae]